MIETHVWMVTPKNIAGFYTHSDLPIVIGTHDVLQEAVKKIMDENNTVVVEVRRVPMVTKYTVTN